jgi:hypothetical protein
MRSLVWMASASVGCAAVVDALTAGQFRREIWLGMAGPLLVASVSWIAAERVYETSPGRLTAMMIGAFAGKLGFFAAYVAVAIAVLGVQPVPFVASFSGYFIALHLIEALLLKRLFVS